MSRWSSAVRLEVTTQVRQKFLHAALISGLLWLALLLPIPRDVRPIIEPYVLVGDIAIIGFFFIGASVFFEKQERTLGALICTPLRFREYLSAKITVLSAISWSLPSSSSSSPTAQVLICCRSSPASPWVP